MTVGGQAIAYRAVAGTLTVGSTRRAGRDAGTLRATCCRMPGVKPPDPEKPDEAPATARMFYVAYFKKDAAAERGR